MNRSQQLRAFYLELRDIMGSEVPGSELAELAAALVEFANDELKVKEDPAPRPTFEEQDVDKALADGGWSIAHREPHLWGEYDDEGKLESLRLEERIKRYMNGLTP